MNLTKDNESLFLILSDELNQHYLEAEIAIIKECYETVSSYFYLTQTENTLFLASLNTTIDLAKLGLSYEFIVSALLYYPVVTEHLSVSNHIYNLGWKITKVIKNLLKIEDLIERSVSWGRKVSQRVSMESKKHSKKSLRDELLTYKMVPNTFLALAQDPEIVIVKLVQRLHLLKFAKQLFPNESQNMALAQETLDIHARVAENIGVWSIKRQLEDESFNILQPDHYQAIIEDLREGQGEREKLITKAIEIMRLQFLKKDITGYQITGRPKNIYGLHLKMIKSGKTVHEINDNLDIRILVKTIEECYRVLYILTSTWQVAEGIYGDHYFKDWIISPKSNGYQSIHITVHYPEDKNRLLEIQIRTYDMHYIAEFGSAAHWIYKESNNFRQQKNYKKYIHTFEDILAHIKKLSNQNLKS